MANTHGYLEAALKARGLEIVTKKKRSIKPIGDIGGPRAKFSGAASRQSKQDKSDDIKILGKCQLCDKKCTTPSKLSRHIVESHFRELLKERFSHLVSGNNCTLCGKEFKIARKLIIHIGSKHNKLEEIMVEKGLMLIQDIFNPKFNNMEIKNEKVQSQNDITTTDNPEDNCDNIKILGKCQLCDKKFMNPVRTDMSHHERTPHKGIERKVQSPCLRKNCTLCGKEFKRAHRLITHIGNKHKKLEEIMVEKGLKLVHDIFMRTKKEKVQVQNDNYEGKSDDIKILGKCQLCDRKCKTPTELSRHIVESHFSKELKERFSHFVSGNNCILCGKEVKSSPLNLIKHIANKHNKLEDHGRKRTQTGP